MDYKATVIVISVFCATLAVILFMELHNKPVTPPEQQKPSVIYIPSTPQVIREPYFIPDFNYGYRDGWDNDRNIIINNNNNAWSKAIPMSNGTKHVVQHNSKIEKF